ncbi:MAG: hypothetical protein KGV51_04735 [Moraxellaceae bacterium]|nr:hypothetical protein [Moraxellaceae bacterium]
MKYYNPKTKEIAEIIDKNYAKDMVTYKVGDKEITEKYEDFIKKFHGAVKDN